MFYWSRSACIAFISAPLSALVIAAPVDSLAPLPASGPNASGVQAQIDALDKSTQALEARARRLLRLGNGTQSDLAALLASIQQLHEQQRALQDGQIAQKQQQIKLQSSTGLSRVSGDLTTSSSAEVSGGPPLIAPGNGPVVPASALAPSQQSIAGRQQALVGQIRDLRKNSPEDTQAIADAINQWQQANAAASAAGESAASAEHVRALAREQSAGGVTAGRALQSVAVQGSFSESQTSPSNSLQVASANSVATQGAPPMMKALSLERQTANRELAKIIQNTSLSRDAMNAALSQWRAAHASSLDQLSIQAESESKARAIAAEAKAAATQPTNLP